ncbi:MAG: GNAT family N-acetyltransferase [Leifsonia sp.]
MRPITLRTERLVLDQPADGDVEGIAEYCRDPLFQRWLTTPWPYERRHAEGYVTGLVPDGWASGTEMTWAMRTHDAGPLIGVVCYRTERSDVGFWLGADARGRGYMREALGAVAQWAFVSGDVPHTDALTWEALVGNRASAAVAQAVGFAFTGTAPSSLPTRDGSLQPSWHGILLRSNDAAQALASWPEETRL